MDKVFFEIFIFVQKGLSVTGSTEGAKSSSRTRITALLPKKYCKLYTGCYNYLFYKNLWVYSWPFQLFTNCSSVLDLGGSQRKEEISSGNFLFCEKIFGLACGCS